MDKYNKEALDKSEKENMTTFCYCRPNKKNIYKEMLPMRYKFTLTYKMHILLN